MRHARAYNPRPPILEVETRTVAMPREQRRAAFLLLAELIADKGVRALFLIGSLGILGRQGAVEVLRRLAARQESPPR